MQRETINKEGQKVRKEGRWGGEREREKEEADEDETKRRGGEKKEEVPFMLFILVLFHRAPCYLGKLP